MVSPQAEEVGVFGYDPINGGWFSWLAAMLLALVLAYAIHRQRRKARRRSLKRDGDGYVWIELDGSPGRSSHDPRDRWDAEDAADADGDGGGD
jgi:hypothetical protein